MLTGVYPNAEPERRYTIEETAKMLGIHRNTLRGYTESHYIRPVQHFVGARVYYMGAEINAFWKKEITP